MDNQNPEIKFLHYRYSGANGDILAGGGLTIAYEDNGDGTLRWAAARCHPNDNFVKVTGRHKAAGRLRSQHYAKLFKVDQGVDVEATFVGEIEEGVAAENAMLGPARSVEFGSQVTLVRKFNGKRKSKTA